MVMIMKGTGEHATEEFLTFVSDRSAGLSQSRRRLSNH